MGTKPAVVVLGDLLPRSVHNAIKRRGLWGFSVVSPLALEDAPVVTVYVHYGKKRRTGTQVVTLPVTAYQNTYA